MARSRELKVVISGDPSQLNRAFAKAGVAAGQFENRVGKASTGIARGLGTAAKVGAAAIGVGLVGALKGSIDAFAEAERVGAQTNAVLKSTGGSANLTAKEIGALATAISKKSGMDDEAIQSGENLLLTFTKIRDEQGKGNDIFTQATGIMADMSTALGQDTKSSAIQLGKALNDPIKGVTALQRVGVSFTKSQRDQITTLVESGKTMDAQKLILKELRTEFGGSAEAAGDTFSGKINKAKVSLGNLGEAIGGVVAPALGDAADKLAGFVDNLASSDRPAEFFGGIKDFASDAKDAVDDLFHTFDALKSTRGSAGAAIGVMFADAFEKIDWTAIGQKISTGLGTALRLGGNISGQVEQGLQAAFSDIDGRKVLGGLLDTIGEALDALFSPSFWIEHFSAIFSVVTFVIPVGKILKIPGFATLFRFISGPIFRAVGAVGSGLVGLLGRAGSRAFTAFLAEIERAFPRVANAMLRIATGGANALRSFPGRVASWASRTVGTLVDKLGDAVGKVTGIMGRAVGGGVARLGRGVADFAGAAARLVRAILGKLDDLAGNVPSTIAKALAAGTARMASWVGNFASSAVKLGVSLVTGIIRGVKSKIGSVAGAITGGLGAVADKLNPFGEGIGKDLAQSPGLGPSTIPGGITGSTGLMGAQPALGPIATVGARFGLSVSSGRRPGSITSSGNVSYHSTGEAIDEAGSPGGMMGFFRYMKSNFGSRLAELIYTPGGAGIKNGQPHTYTGQVAADHFDHVHVALDTGRPGVGDGIGDVTRLARAAGFKGQALINAIAVAGAESGFRSGASNRNTNGSIDRGYWQINSIHGARSTFDPMGNARAAFAISSGGSNWRPWVTYNTGAYRRFLGQARAAAGRSTGAGTTGTVPTSRGGGGTAPARDTTSPYELAIAGSDVEIAEAQQGGVRRGAGGRIVSSAGLRETQAQYGRLRTVNRRITSVRKRLATAKTRAGKLRLRNELAQLYGERNTITGRITELRTPPEVTESGGGADGGGGEGDPNQALIDAINAKAEQDRQLAEEAAARAEEQRRATEEHTAALNAVQAEVKRQTDFAASATATTNYQAWKALADILSGKIGGLGIARSFTPGAGVEYAF